MVLDKGMRIESPSRGREMYNMPDFFHLGQQNLKLVSSASPF